PADRADLERTARPAAAAVVLADVPAAAADGTVPPPVAGRGRWPVPGGRPGRVCARGRPRGGTGQGAGGRRAGPGGQARRWPDRAGGRVAARLVPDVPILDRAARWVH